VSRYSLNVPVPPTVGRLASGLASECLDADRRTRHSLVGKRLGDAWRVTDPVREALQGLGPFRIRVAGVERFQTPPTGRAPVVYLAVESKGLWTVHRRLCEVVDPVPAIEGREYVPHVTIARGPDAATLVGRSAGPVEWTVERLAFYDAHHRVTVESIALPA
jgi:2'-5' RNA ligase